MMEACFVNTDQKPLSKLVIGLHIEKGMDRELHLYTFIRYSYPHPEAPSSMSVDILKKEKQKTIKKWDKGYAAMYLLWCAQRNVWNVWELENA